MSATRQLTFDATKEGFLLAYGLTLEIRELEDWITRALNTPTSTLDFAKWMTEYNECRALQQRLDKVRFS